MANRLSSSQREALFASFAEKQTVEYVSEKCGVHHATVRRYRVADRWDERFAHVRAEAHRQANVTLAEAMAESLKMVRDYKEKLRAAVARKDLTSSDVSVQELKRLIRLEAFVLGAAESRHEVVTSFSGWSEEELERFAQTGERPARPSGGKARA